MGWMTKRPSRRYDGAEEARTRGFATPAFAGCALGYVVVARGTIPPGTDFVNMGAIQPGMTERLLGGKRT